MKLPAVLISNSEEETKNIAIEFLKHLKDGDVIVLNGDLGTGKTFFIKKIAEELNINNANSPTFAIVNEYNGNKKIYHFDFYRINKVNELHDIGLEDYLTDQTALTFIEWGNLFPEILPGKRYEINITIVENEKRKFEITKFE